MRAETLVNRRDKSLSYVVASGFVDSHATTTKSTLYAAAVRTIRSRRAIEGIIPVRRLLDADTKLTVRDNAHTLANSST
jgi:hypothetical protein